MSGGENINKILVAAALVLSIGLVIGGYSFLLNDGAGDLTDSSLPNELNNSSKDNVSLGDNGKVSNVNSNNNQNVNSNNGKVAKDISANELIDIVQVSPIQPISAFADDDIPAMYINVGYAASYNIGDNSYHNGAGIAPGAFDNINKSEYMLSPNYDEHIFIKIGQDFTDLFVQCVDGDFIALGDITKPLPEKGICDLSCGAGDAYFDLNGPNVDYRNYDDVVYYIEHGKYPSDDQQVLDVVNKSEYVLSPNYDEHIFIKIGQDFTDLFVQCVDGDFIALGDITKPLPEKGICDLSCGAGDAYFDLNGPNVDYRNYDDVVYYIEHGKYPADDQQVLGVIPIDGDEQGYGGDYVEEPNDVNPINDDLPQENAVVENPQIVADFTTVG